MFEDLKGKSVLVTGAATGIGKATSKLFASLGAKVAVATAHNVTAGEAVAEEIRKEGGEAFFVQCDVSNEESVKKCINSVVEKFGSLDIAFNNAGVGADGVRIPFTSMTDTTEELWDKVVNTNMKGTFFCLKHEIIQMKDQGKGGAIVNTASIGGLKMAPDFGAYGPSKAGVIALTQQASNENAKHGIRVNVVCPGPTTGTELMKNNLQTNPEEEKMLKEHVIPMGKLGTAEIVADAVVFLCSDMAGHTTGQSFSVDGGMHCM